MATTTTTPRATTKTKTPRKKTTLTDTLAGVCRIAETEGEFMAAVIELATVLHWRVYHTRDSRGSQQGFPDLILVKDGAVIAAECKREGGGRSRLTDAQRDWLDAFCACPGVLAAVCYPHTWDTLYTVLSLGGAAVLGLAADQAREAAQARDADAGAATVDTTWNASRRNEHAAEADKMSDAGTTRKRCPALRKDGRPCRANALPDTGLCIGHSPHADLARRPLFAANYRELV